MRNNPRKPIRATRLRLFRQPFLVMKQHRLPWPRDTLHLLRVVAFQRFRIEKRARRTVLHKTTALPTVQELIAGQLENELAGTAFRTFRVDFYSCFVAFHADLLLLLRYRALDSYSAVVVMQTNVVCWGPIAWIVDLSGELQEPKLQLQIRVFDLLTARVATAIIIRENTTRHNISAVCLSGKQEKFGAVCLVEIAYLSSW